jgi:hypothetical protein
MKILGNSTRLYMALPAIIFLLCAYRGSLRFLTLLTHFVCFQPAIFPL